MLVLLITLAEAGQEAPGWSSFMPIILMVLLGYFLLFRPMQRQERERQAMVAGLKKKDRVITSGGIIGVVDSIKEGGDEVSLRIDENSPVRLRVTKGSIVRVLTADDGGKDKETKEEG